jgi:hypothetical protein
MRRLLVSIASLIALDGTVVHAQVVGTVADRATIAKYKRGVESPQAVEFGSDVRSGDTLVTSGDLGKLRVHFEDRAEVILMRTSELYVSALPATSSTGQGVFELRNGKVFVSIRPGPGGEVSVTTSVGHTASFHTEYVVAFDPAAQRMQVVGVSGLVDVVAKARCSGRSLRLGARELTTIVRGGCPSQPEALDDASFSAWTTDGDFVGGGRAETLPRFDGPDLVADGVLPTFKPRGPESIFDRPDCTTPADCLKPPVVPSGGIDVRF